jgi:hypothetical protein
MTWPRTLVLMLLLFGFGSAALAQTDNPALPDAPQPENSKQLKTRPTLTPAQAKEQLRLSQLPYVNGERYDQPSSKDLTLYYLTDTFLLPGQTRSMISALYSQARERPAGWGDDFSGFAQRLGSAEGITAINGTVRMGMEFLFHEDLRYIPCHHCSVKRKIANAFLSEVTARHGVDGKRIFSLTPEISDFAGPIVAHTLWFPNYDPFAGVVATRVVAAVRVATHLAQEYLVEHRHRRGPQ